MKKFATNAGLATQGFLVALLCGAAIPSHTAAASLPATSPVALARLKSLSPPTLGAIPATTTANPIIVTGVAPSGTQQVRLYVNGELLQLVVGGAGGDIDAAGNFSAKVPLFDGANTVYATAWDGATESTASASQSTSYTNNLSTSQSGTISSDTVWTPGAGIYHLTGNLTVASGKTLWLMPGVRVLVDGDFSWSVDGTLIAQGTDAGTNSILLGSGQSSPAPEQWRGVRVRGSGRADLNFVTIEHSRDALTFDSGNGEVRNSTFRKSRWGIVVYKAAAPQFVAGNRVHANANGVWIETDNVGAQPRFTDGVIFDNDSTPGDNDTSIDSDKNVQTSDGGSGAGIILNFSGNWWGSGVPTSIAASITDYSDFSFGARPAVDFSGYLESEGGSPAFAGIGLVGRISDRTLASGSYELLGSEPPRLSWRLFGLSHTVSATLVSASRR